MTVPGQSDQSVGGEEPRVIGDGLLEQFVDHGLGIGQLGGRRRVREQEPLGDPHAPDLQGHHRELRVVGSRARHQLGRSSTDVQDQERPLVGVEVGDRTGHRQPPLLGPHQQFGLDAGHLAGRPQEFVAVGGVPGGRRGGQPSPGHGALVHDLPVLPQHGQAAADGFGGQHAGGVHPRPQPGDLHGALERGPVVVDDQQPGGVGPAVDGRHGSHMLHLTLLPRWSR